MEKEELKRKAIEIGVETCLRDVLAVLPPDLKDEIPEFIKKFRNDDTNNHLMIGIERAVDYVLENVHEISEGK